MAYLHKESKVIYEHNDGKWLKVFDTSELLSIVAEVLRGELFSRKGITRR
jgi:hypothetical protein